jgi:tRNA/rRNA methyltransferase
MTGDYDGAPLRWELPVVKLGGTNRRVKGNGVPQRFLMLYVVLVATRNPLNIGAAARAMSNFGFLRLRVVNPYEVAWREARSAVGAAELLTQAEEFDSVATAVADCSMVVGTTAGTGRELQHEVLPLPQAADAIREHQSSANVALLFGSEKRGLSNDDLTHCHWLLRIPTRPEHASMNLGQAVAVCLYEIAKVFQVSRRTGSAYVPSEHAERITEALGDALKVSGYIKGQGAKSTEAKLRRLVRRMNLSPQDAEDVLGMLNKILWKLRSTERR